MAKILVADDEPLIRLLIADALSRSGHLVVQAEDGVTAFQMCAEQDLDLIVTDIMMPRLGGIDLIQQTRALFPGIRHIAFSGVRSEVEHCRDMGIAALEKPFQMDDLLSAIEDVLHDRVHA